MTFDMNLVVNTNQFLLATTWLRDEQRQNFDNRSQVAPILAENWIGDRTIQGSAPNATV